VAVDAAGNLLIADTGNNRIRRVDGATGVITTVAGTGPTGSEAGSFSGDGGPAVNANLRFPSSVAVDASGNLYIADGGNHRIRRVDSVTGIITTAAGSGSFGFSGDGGPATDAQLAPSDIAVDASGNLFIADANNNRIRRVDGATGVITTVAGTGTAGHSGDGGPATSASLFSPRGVAVDAAGNLFFAVASNRIRRVDAATGIITTVAGSGASGFSGDGGPAISASLFGPAGVAVDAAGNLFIADFRNNRIRRVEAAVPAAEVATPKPTAAPASTLVSRTSTPASTPTATPIPTSTPAPPTVSPTRAPLPFPDTPRPATTPTAAPVLATATLVPPTTAPTPAAVVSAAQPTPTAEPSGGGFCGSNGHTPLRAGLGNVLFLLAPLALLAVHRRLRRR
jgi:sugar lactone lactonase YvrE